MFPPPSTQANAVAVQTNAQTEAAERDAFLWASIATHPDITGITSAIWSNRRSNTHRSHRRKRGQRLPAPHAHHARWTHNQPPTIINHHMASFATQIYNITVALNTSQTVIDATTSNTFEHAQLIRGANSD
jgi:hypothetical protein